MNTNEEKATRRRAGRELWVGAPLPKNGIPEITMDHSQVSSETLDAIELGKRDMLTGRNEGKYRVFHF